MMAHGLGMAALMAFVVMPATAGPGAHGPDGQHLDAPAATTVAGLARLPDGSVRIPKLAQRRMGIRTVIAEQAGHPMTVELNAVVTIDPNAGGRLQAGHPGWVEPPPGGFPALGQSVRKGEVLALLRHKAEPFEAGNQQAQLAGLSANLELARQRLQRLESLQDSIPRKDIEAARAEVQSLSGQRSAVGRSLQAVIPLRAPATGVIATSNVVAGQVVTSEDVLYEVVDPVRLQVEASTADTALVTRIRDGELKHAVGGKLAFVGAGRSLKNGAVPLLFRTSGDPKATAPLAVGQPVTVIARLSDMVNGIALPSEALVRGPNNESVVWIKSGAQRFIAQPVEAVVLDARTIVVVKGLAAENRVVASGAALVNQIR
jgi:hypothetical protein